MSNTVKNKQFEGLYQELEERYGPAMAQGIVDQVKKAEKKNYVPDYMPVKALSEAIEVIRPEAQSLLKQIKQNRFKANAVVIHLDQKKLKQEFEHLFDCYWQLQKTFYTLYSRFMNAYAQPVAANYKYNYYRESLVKAAA